MVVDLGLAWQDRGKVNSQISGPHSLSTEIVLLSWEHMA